MGTNELLDIEKDLLAGIEPSENINVSEIASTAAEEKLPTITRGRPKSKPASKAVIFHLPLEIIAQIEAEAERITIGNKSAFAVKVFSEYFNSKE